MPRQLWLLRHADAEPHGTREDSARRLTERGERQARLAGEALALMGVELDALLSSPKERALRTATVVAQAWSERSELGQSELGQSELGQSEIGQSEIGQAEIGQSEIGQSEIGQAEIGGTLSAGPGQREQLEIHAPLAEGFDARQALAVLSALPSRPRRGGQAPPARVLLVGHEPDLSTVVAELTGARIDLKKGGLAVVRVDGGGGELIVLLRPSELALIAQARVAVGAPAR